MIISDGEDWTKNVPEVEFPEEKIVKLGNSALIGAKMALFLDYKCCEDILNISEHISLETDPGFEDIFIDKMIFR